MPGIARCNIERSEGHVTLCYSKIYFYTSKYLPLYRRATQQTAGGAYTEVLTLYEEIYRYFPTISEIIRYFENLISFI